MHQQADALIINAVPKSPAFGPNDWIYVNVKIHTSQVVANSTSL